MTTSTKAIGNKQQEKLGTTTVDDLFDFFDSDDDEKNIKFTPTTPGVIASIKSFKPKTKQQQRTLDKLPTSMRLDSIVGRLLDFKSYINHESKANEFDRLIELILTKFNELQSEKFHLLQQINALEKENDTLYEQSHTLSIRADDVDNELGDDDEFNTVEFGDLEGDKSVILVHYSNEHQSQKNDQQHPHKHNSKQHQHSTSTSTTMTTTATTADNYACFPSIAPWTRFYKRHKQGMGESLRIAIISSPKLTNTAAYNDDYFDDTLQSIVMRCYFPRIFKKLREIYGVSLADFLASFKANHLLQINECTTSSLSGSSFFYSFDGKYIIKSMRKEEVAFIKQMISKYCAYIEEQQSHTFMTRYMAMFKIIDTAHTANHNAVAQHFIVMNNVYFDVEQHSPHQHAHDEHEHEHHLLIYDLKGSKYNRITEKQNTNFTRQGLRVLKDYDWMATQTKLDVSEAEAQRIRAQIFKDIQFLKSLEIMDYSLLIAMYDVDNDDGGDNNNNNKKKNNERRHHAHTHSKKTLRAKLGVIDILQHFTFWKQMEGNGAYYLLGIDEYDIVDPEKYANRLYKFVCDFVV